MAVDRARFRQRADGEEFGTIYADYNAVLSATSIRATGALAGGGQSGRHRVSTSPPTRTHDQPRQRSSTRPTSSTRRRPVRCFTRSRSAPSSAGRPACRSVIPASFRTRTKASRSSSTRSIRPISGRSLFIIIMGPRRTTLTPTAGIASISQSGYAQDHDRAHPLAAADRRRPLRPLRLLGARSEHRHTTRDARRREGFAAAPP